MIKGKENPKHQKGKNMRVTKVVREYIEKRVREKVYLHYEDEKTKATEEMQILDYVTATAQTAAINVYLEVLNDLASKYNFLEVNEDIEDRVHISAGYKDITIKDRNLISSPHCWRLRADKEAKDVADDIVINLELGGTKKDLEEMLAKI